MDRIPCTGCSLLCDDILIRTDGIFIDEIVGACIKGTEHFEQCTAKNRITHALIQEGGEQKSVSLDIALNKAIQILKNSSKPLFYGFSTTNCEAQLRGMQLAEKVDGFIDSNAIICQGKVLNASKEHGLTLTSLSEIINKSDLLVFWGANPAESIPRLLNKTVFSRGKFRMTGREIRTMVIIDPVKTASFKTMGVRDIALNIDPNKDYELIAALKEECCTSNNIPPKKVAGLDSDDMKRFLMQLSGAENGVIFVGQGLLRPQNGHDLLKEILELVELINEKQQKGRISMVLMSGHYNMTGFEHVALSNYGINHSLQFSKGSVAESEDTIISKIQKEDFDCSVIVGTDPISHFPIEISKKLASKPIIIIDNRKSATVLIADVVLPSAITGIERAGLVYRLDHVPIELKKILNPPSNVLSDEELLQKISEGLEGE